MDTRHRIEGFLAAHGSVITTAEATRLGVTANELRGLQRAGVLTRVGRGCYVWAEVADGLSVSARHLLAVRALLRSRPGQVGASHQSAAVLHGLPVLNRDLGRVHVSRCAPTKETRRHDTFTVHRCPGPDAFGLCDGLTVVVPSLAVVGTAVLAGVDSGIMAADAALRRGLTTKAELAERLELMRHTPGLGAARHVVAAASPSAESPGESLSRLILAQLGYRVLPQVTVVDEGGVFVARVDFLLPDLGVVVEFDGAVKYAGQEGAKALAAEKRREDRLRALGYGVARLVWSDLAHPARVQAAVSRAARLASPALRRAG